MGWLEWVLVVGVIGVFAVFVAPDLLIQFWLQDSMAEQRDAVNEQLTTQVDIRSLSCDAASDEVQFFASNTGKNEIDTATVDISVYERGGTAPVAETTASMASFKPGENLDKTVTLGADLVDGTTYEVTLTFGSTAAAKTCVARR